LDGSPWYNTSLENNNILNPQKAIKVTKFNNHFGQSLKMSNGITKMWQKIREIVSITSAVKPSNPSFV
jgi:hypothetical protein